MWIYDSVYCEKLQESLNSLERQNFQIFSVRRQEGTSYFDVIAFKN